MVRGKWISAQVRGMFAKGGRFRDEVLYFFHFCIFRVIEVIMWPSLAFMTCLFIWQRSWCKGFPFSLPVLAVIAFMT